MKETSTNTKLSIHRCLIVIVSFMVLLLVFGTSVSCMGVYVKPVSEAFEISRTTFSMTITFSSLAMIISGVVAGRLLGKYNIKWLMAIGIFFCGASMFLYGTAQSIVIFYFVAVIMGTSVTFTCTIPVSILINNWFPKESTGLAMGIAMVGSGAGSMILNPLYTWIIGNFGWRQSFCFAGAMIIGLLIPLVLLIVEREPKELPSAGNGLEENVKKEKKIVDGLSLNIVIKKPVTWATFIGFVVAATVNMTVLSQGIAYLTDSGYTAQTAANVIAAGSGALIIGKIIMGALDDKIGTRRNTIFCALLLTLCFVAFYLMGYVESAVVIAAYTILYSLGAPISSVSMPMVIKYMYGDKEFSSIMGLFSMTAGMGGMLQSLISLSYDSTGSYSAAWIVILTLSVISIIIFGIAIRPQYGDRK